MWIIWLSRHFKMQHHDWVFISSRNFIFNWFYQYQKSLILAKFQVKLIFEYVDQFILSTFGKKIIRTFLWYFQSCYMYFVVSRREFILVFDWRKRSSFHLWFSLMLRWMHLQSLHVILLTYCYFHRVFLSFKCMFKHYT